MMHADLLAILAACCFGLALVSGRLGSRSLDALSGAAISIPSAAAVLLLLAPWRLDTHALSAGALLAFGALGLVFPALVTLLTFRSNELLGPTVTSAVSASAPLFALLAAIVWLAEPVPPRTAMASLGVVAGVALLSWRGAAGREFGALLLWPIAGALVRGVSQAGAKAALTIWQNAFAATLVGYLVSALVAILAARLITRGRHRGQRRAHGWFVLTGLLNGLAVLAMYSALGAAPVSRVAPIVAAYPLVTSVVSIMLLPDEPFAPRRILASMLIVAAVAYLLSGPTALA